MITAFLHSAFAHGAVSGLLGAVLVDFRAFKNWQSFQDAAKYNWGIALWRWLQGAVIGGASGAGYGLLG